MTETCGAAFVATDRKIHRGDMMAGARSMTSVPVAGSSTATKTHRRQVLATSEPSGLQQARSGTNRTLSRNGGISVNNFATFRPVSSDYALALRKGLYAIADWTGFLPAHPRYKPVSHNGLPLLQRFEFLMLGNGFARREMMNVIAGNALATHMVTINLLVNKGDNHE